MKFDKNQIYEIRLLKARIISMKDILNSFEKWNTPENGYSKMDNIQEKKRRKLDIKKAQEKLDNKYPGHSKIKPFSKQDLFWIENEY